MVCVDFGRSATIKKLISAKDVARREASHTWRVVVTVCFVMCAVAPYSSAETPENSESAEQLEEVVVNAQKRPENLQSVPISITVLTDKQLSVQNLDSLQDVALTDPSVRVNGSSGRNGTLFLRGIGSGGNTAFDEAVGVYIDDIYHGHGHQSSETFLDVDRIETLKGPQGLFFGNNSIAGAFNIISKQPSGGFGGSIRAWYGQFGQYGTESALNVPVSDRFQARVAIMAAGEDGWAVNAVDGQKYPHTDNLAGRVTLHLTPDEDLDGTLKLGGGRDKNTGGLFLSVRNCPPPAPFISSGFCKAGLDATASGKNDGVSELPGQEVDLSNDEDVLTLRYKGLAAGTVTSVTGFYDYNYLLNLDTAGTPVDEITASQQQRYQQLSQELRLVSPPDSTLEYITGLYFQNDELFSTFYQDFFYLTPTITRTRSLQSLLPFLPLGEGSKYKQIEHVYSAFASVLWRLSDSFKISAGLRESQVNKDYDLRLYYGTAGADYGGLTPLPSGIANVPVALNLGTPATLSGGRSDRALMPSWSVQYQIDPRAMAYVSYSRGFLSGGFNADDTSGIATRLPFGPEYVNSYQIGVNSELGDRRFVGNFDFFRSVYSDLQVGRDVVSASGVLTSEVQNAASVLSQGVEAELDWLIGTHFRMAADITYLNAYYTSFSNAAPTVLESFEGQRVADDTGWRTPYAPNWAGTLTSMYQVNLPASATLSVEAQTIGASAYYLNVLDRRTGAYFEVNGRASLERGEWSLDLVGKNLTNREILIQSAGQSTSPGTSLVAREPPRSIAVQVRFRF